MKQWHDWAAVQNTHIHMHMNIAILMTISSGPLASNTACGLNSASWKCFLKMCTHTFSFCKQHYSNERLLYSWMKNIPVMLHDFTNFYTKVKGLKKSKPPLIRKHGLPNTLGPDNFNVSLSIRMHTLAHMANLLPQENQDFLYIFL